MDCQQRIAPRRLCIPELEIRFPPNPGENGV
jgi:hypothetical protein